MLRLRAVMATPPNSSSRSDVQTALPERLICHILYSIQCRVFLSLAYSYWDQQCFSFYCHSPAIFETGPAKRSVCLCDMT